ncbi:HET-domain-containing protein, partial [Mytilinidion resinicola]
MSLGCLDSVLSIFRVLSCKRETGYEALTEATSACQPACEPYEYEPLPGDEYTRLLEFQPGRGIISCKLLPVSIENARGTYEAISYVWGDAADTIDITCDGMLLSITQNLGDVLRRIRGGQEPRLLWADAICINQNDKKEQGHQVERMGRIYENASRVLIWIGKDDGAARRLLKMPFVPQNGGRLPEDTRVWNSVRNLTEHAWFGRVWVLQEVGLAASALFLYGDFWMDWCELAKFILLTSLHSELAHYTNPDVSQRFTQTYHSLWKAYSNPTSWRAELTSITKGFLDNQVAYIDILENGRRYQTTDPRDHVYAFLGHPAARLQDGRQIVTVDYKKSVDDVYFETARAMIENGPHPWMVLATVNH